MRRIIAAWYITAAIIAIGVPLTSSGAQGAGATARDDGKIPITTRSDSARALFLKGRTASEALTAHEARGLFDQAVALDTAFAMAEYYLASGSTSHVELMEHLRRALALADDVSPGERLTILGMQARQNADPARARQLAESLVVLYPRDERARLALAILESAQREYPRAIAEYQDAVAINPGYALAYNQLGYAYRSVGDMGAAEAAFRKYISLVPDDPNPYDSYAELLMKTGRFDESIVQYRKALSASKLWSRRSNVRLCWLMRIRTRTWLRAGAQFQLCNILSKLVSRPGMSLLYMPSPRGLA